MSTSSISSVGAADTLLVRDVDGQYRPAHADEVLCHARRLLANRVRRGATMSSPQAVKDHLRLEIGALEHEVFCVLFLDAQHRLVAAEELFRGTLSQTAVYQREVLRRAIELNAAAVVLAHNHPSGLAEPSTADDLLTQALARALGQSDIRVLDHVVVTAASCYSFAEHGRIG